QTELGSRATYKRALVAAAIEKATLGYQVVADEPMTAFWANYRELVERHAPALNMQGQPGAGRPSTSTFIRFRPDRFPKNRQLIHKFTRGHVGLEFTGWGDELARLREIVGPIAPEGSTLVRIGKAAAFRVRVPVLSVTSPLDQEAD